MILATNRMMRRGLVITEVVVLAGLNVEQAVQRLVLDEAPPTGEILYFWVGAVIGVLALLRRRFPGPARAPRDGGDRAVLAVQRGRSGRRSGRKARR